MHTIRYNDLSNSSSFGEEARCSPQVNHLVNDIHDHGCNLLRKDYIHSLTVNSVSWGLSHKTVIDFHRASVKEGGSVVRILEGSRAGIAVNFRADEHRPGWNVSVRVSQMKLRPY